MAKHRARKSKSGARRSSRGGSDPSPWIVGGVALAAGLGAFFLLRPRSAAARAPTPLPLPGSTGAGGGQGATGGTPGEAHPATRDLQRRLNAWGAGIPDDGVYGPRTDDAVQQYGTQIGLSASDIAELHTRHTESDVARIVGHTVYTLPTMDV